MVGIVMQNKDRGGVMLKIFHSVSLLQLFFEGFNTAHKKISIASRGNHPEPILQEALGGARGCGAPAAVCSPAASRGACASSKSLSFFSLLVHHH